MALHHDDHVGQRRDDPVAGREPPPLGWGAQRVLGQEDASGDHLLPERAVAGRVDDVEARGDHGRRRPAAIEGTSVGGPVDAQGQARHDADPGLGQVPTELGRDRTADGGAAAGADDCHPGPGQGGGLAPGEEDRRRFGIGEEARRPSRLVG
jgi:hypothetical protein